MVGDGVSQTDMTHNLEKPQTENEDIISSIKVMKDDLTYSVLRKGSRYSNKQQV